MGKPPWTKPAMRSGILGVERTQQRAPPTNGPTKPRQGKGKREGRQGERRRRIHDEGTRQWEGPPEGKSQSLVAHPTT